MRRRFGLVILTLLWLTVAIGAIAQQKVTLQYKAQKGQKMTYRLEADLQSEFGGQKIQILVKQTSVDEILDVAQTGEITRQSYDEEVEMTVNGQKMPTPEDVSKQRTIMVMKPDGTIVSVKWEGGREPTEAERKSRMRLLQATQLVFPANPVGVGDKWTREYKEDTEKGTPAAVGEYELLALEKAKGVDTAKLRYTYRETSGERQMSLQGEVWVEVASGDAVVLNLKAENFPFAPSEQAPPFSGNLRAERTGGSPIGGAAAAAQPAEAPKKKEKTIEEVVKDYEKIEGLFTLYRKKEAGKDTVYMEIREDQLNRLMLLQVTQSTGTGGYSLAAGNPIDDILFKFVQRDDQILFVVPNIRFRADENQPIARAVKRSFADAYLEAFRIEARSEERKSLLINIGDLFRSDIAQITRLAQSAGGAYGIDREKTVINAIKNFPNNLVVQTAYHLVRAGGGGGGPSISIPGMSSGAPLADPRSLPLVINYNLFFLPENGYRPRLADPRVGYFVTEFQDFTQDKDDQTTRYILRWHLEKADLDAPLSPPKEPIVFWLDNAIPTEYRDAVREGILWWNKAFERIGIKDAIVVKQMPDDADWDHADMRYNVIRWVTSPSSGYAVALFRANPLTGQIVNASITVDANMTRFARAEFKRMIDPLSAFDPEPLPANPFLCNLAEEAAYQAWFGATAMKLMQSPKSTRISEAEYVKQYIREVVAHEMGHILGLRHNFIASTLHPTKDLADAERINHQGMTASVMDYTPVNIVALHSPRSAYWTQGLGVYDYWAIEYGYKPSNALTPEGELPMLRAIARRGTERGLAYQGDEFADSVDPLITRFDLGKDPLEYWATIFRDVNLMIPQLPAKAVKLGENYYEMTRSFNGLLSMYARAASAVSRYIGGVHLRRNHRGDPNEKPPVTPVSAADQKRALALLTQYVFSPKAFNFPKEVYLKLAPDPYPDYEAMLTSRPRLDAPVRDTISGIQVSTLRRLFRPQTLSQIANNEFKARKPEETLTMTALFEQVSNAVNAEIINGTNVPALRRLLQRTYLRTLADMVVNPDSEVPDDARMLARYHLRRLKSQILAVHNRPLDTSTRVHLDEMLSEINRVLNAQYTIGSSSEPASPVLSPRR
ncbi:MAG: zinc-dependent metalloprotease [Chthonomonadetes bacterium]|nr:zinc-dependent metalloprotease [Chthonomonadetes bacterium]